MDPEQQRIVKRVTTTAVKAIIYSGANVKNILDSMSNMYDPKTYMILEQIIREAEEIANWKSQNKEIRYFYCGRCMRFLDEKCFNDTQRDKARSGEGGYCIECASSTLVTNIDIENSTIVRSVVPSPYMLSKKDQDQPSSSSAKTKKLENSETEEMASWRRDPTNIEKMVRAFASAVQVGLKKVVHIEIVLFQGEKLQFLNEISENWIRLETEFYIIVSSSIERELTEQEIEDIKSKSVSFKVKKRN